MKQKKFIITCPPYGVMLSIMVGIVYGAKAGWETLAMLFVYGTIMENFI